jgi:iron complex transport system substrate-binding protein
LLVLDVESMTRSARQSVPLAALVLGVVLLAGAFSAPAAAAHDDAGCPFPVSETDMTGTTVSLDEPAGEVVVLDASSAQVFWEIGAEKRVTGMPVEDFTAYLGGSEERRDVTDGQQVLAERVVELDPDLVVAPNYLGEETIAQLRGAGLAVYQFPLEDSFEAIYTKTELYGHFVGECEAANETVAETRAAVEEVRESVEGDDRPRVLYFFFGFAAGEETFIHDLIETAGGRNVAAEAGVTGYVELSEEVVLTQDPEWIVAPSHAGLPEGEPFASTTAFESNQTLVVDENLVSQAGPRVVEPLRAMADAFHPETRATASADTPVDGDTDDQSPLAWLLIGAVLTAGVIVALRVVYRS